MTTSIHFRNMPKSQVLEDHIHEQVKKIERYNLQKACADLWLKREGSMENSGPSLFAVQIRLRRPGQNDLFIKKTGRDFFAGLQRALSALDKKMRRRRKSYAS